MFTPTRLIRPKYLGEQYHEILAPAIGDDNPVIVTMRDGNWKINFQRKMDQPMLIAYYCEKVVDIIFGYLLNEEQRMHYTKHFNSVTANLFGALSVVYQQACAMDKLPMGKVYIDWFTVTVPFYREEKDQTLYLSEMMVLQINLKPVDETRVAANDC